MPPKPYRSLGLAVELGLAYGFGSPPAFRRGLQAFGLNALNHCVAKINNSSTSNLTVSFSITLAIYNPTTD